jgi:tight adherence protein B
VDLVTVLPWILAGPTFVAAMFALLAAWRPPEHASTTAVPAWVVRWWLGCWTTRQTLQVALATGAGLVVGLGTGWPAAAILAAGAGAVAPTLVGARGRREQAVARIEAIATWTEQLRDVMSAAEGIKGAITATAPVAPAAIGPEVRRLADQLAIHHQRLRPALLDFAGDLSHPLGDMVVASLLLATEHSGSPVDVLAEVAASARRTAAMRTEVEASRSQTYVTTRLILVLTVAMSGWLVIAQRQYMAPYATAVGQLVLLLVGAVFAVAGLRLHRMAQPTEPERLLQPAEADR